MKITTQQISLAVVLTLSSIIGVSSNLQGAEAPERLPNEAYPRLAQFKGSQSQKFELPEGIEDILNADTGHLVWGEDTLNPVWPPMPIKGRVLPSNPITGGSIVEGFQLVAQPEKYEVKVLEPIVFRITFRNTTDKDLKFGATSITEKDFVAEVKDSAGQIMPLTVYGKALDPSSMRVPNSRLFHGVIPNKIEAHQEWPYTLEINQIVDMTLSGSYFITIKSSHVKGLISNVVQVDVFPRNTLPKSHGVPALAPDAK